MHRTVLAIMLAYGSAGIVSTARAADHLVPQETTRARLAEAAGSRQQDLETLHQQFSSPQAAFASALGMDLVRGRAGLTGLSDRELRDLAARARSLDSEPTAGLTANTNDLLVVLLIVLIVLVVLRAV